MATAPSVIDVRPIPPPERHAKIFAAFDALAEGEELLLISDHEPRPLRAQFAERRAGSHVWMQRMIAQDEWRVTLRRAGARGDDLGAFLRRCAVFADASAATLRAVTADASERSLARDEAVVEEGRPWPEFGIVRAGTLTAVRTSADGRELGLYDVLPAEVFGEVSLIDGGVALARYAATVPGTRVVLVAKDVMLAAMREDAALSRALGLVSVQRTRAIIERLSAQRSTPTLARVAGVLLAHAAPERGLHPALGTLAGLTQAQLAVAAGTVKEVVSRALMELERAGAIERRGGRIARLDRQKLNGFAERL